MDEEPIEILVRMAESGEIDPWNIDIIEVTDRFLSEVERLQKLDLKVSGRTLFYASLLLRMKSDFLDEPEEDEPLDDDVDEGIGFVGRDDPFAEDDGGLNPIDRFEREIQRRIKRKDYRKSPVTLEELIKQLKNAEKMSRRNQRRQKIPDDLMFLDADDVVSVAHEEDFSDDEEAVYDSYERVSGAVGKDSVMLSDICKDLNQSARSVYLPLLFLMLDGRIILWQEEFFGDIHVARWSPESVGVIEKPDEDLDESKDAGAKKRKRSAKMKSICAEPEESK